MSKPLAGCAGERWEEEMKTPSAFSSEFPVDLCPGQLGRAWAARSSNGAQRCPGSRPILLSASRSHPGSLYHTPSPQSHQICPTRLIFLKPPGLAQPGWGCHGPQRPLLSLGNAVGEPADNGLLSPGRNQTRLGSEAPSTTFLSGRTPQRVPLRRKPDLPKAVGVPQALKMRMRDRDQPPKAWRAVWLPGSFQKAS